MASWLKLNRRLFAARAAWLNRQGSRRGRHAADALDRARGTDDRTEATPRLLHVAWGRIGDAVLGTGMLKHFRTLFPGVEIVHLGREETRSIVAPHVDRFEGFDARAWRRSADERRELVQRLNGPWQWIVGDLHLAYGGFAEFAPMLAGLDAERRIVSAGYSLDPGLLGRPQPKLPPGFECLPCRDPRESARRPVDERHVSHDTRHYLSELCARLAAKTAVPTDLRPVVTLPDLPRRADMDRAVVLQPFSDNRKKDPDPALWDAVCAAFPERRFVALGTDREAIDTISAANVENLGGATSLEEAALLIRDARAFLGPDSGLTHVASALGRPTVCVSQSANLGYFFPYPDAILRGPQWIVDDPASRSCSGCFMTCEHEPIWRTARQGARCLRAIGPQAVIEALRAALAGAGIPQQTRRATVAST